MVLAADGDEFAEKLGHSYKAMSYHQNSCHYILDWNYDEDRCRISKGDGPENITRLRRFAIGLLKSKGVGNVAQKMRQLSFSPRMVFDYLRISVNTHRSSAIAGVE